MIARVVFRALVATTLNIRESIYESHEGWSITEQEPGRVELQHQDGRRVIVQDEPYVLHFKEEPQGGPITGNDVRHALAELREPTPPPTESGPKLKKGRKGRR